MFDEWANPEVTKGFAERLLVVSLVGSERPQIARVPAGDLPGEVYIAFDGTLNVLDAARDRGIERVVVASSSSVYGKPQYPPYDEAHPTTPVSPYGASKPAASATPARTVRCTTCRSWRCGTSQSTARGCDRTWP